MKIFLCGMQPTEDNRTELLVKGFRENGVIVADGRYNAKRLTLPKTRIQHLFYHIRDVLNTSVYSVQTSISFFKQGTVSDFIFLGFPYKYDILFDWLLSRMTRKKLIVDFFMSAYDTAVCDLN